MSFYGGDDGDGSARWGSSSRGGSAGPSNITGITAGTGSRPFLSRLEDSMAGSPPPNNYDGGGGYGGGGMHFDEEGVFSAEALSPGPEEGELDDLRRLGRVWVRERGTPDILAWEGDLIDSLLDKLEQQVGKDCPILELIVVAKDAGDTARRPSHLGGGAFPSRPRPD